MGARRELRIFLGTAGSASVYTVPPHDSSMVTPEVSWSHAFTTPKEHHIEGAVMTEETANLPAPPIAVPSIPIAARTEDDGMFHAPCGRPLRVGDEARVAPPILDHAWTPDVAIDVPLVAGLDAETRRVLGEAWLRDALDEHAAVAAFADLVMSLLALGAPAELLARTQRASLQEVEHARLCFALASVYLGASFGPGPLAVGPIAEADPVALALASWRDGCLGEGAAAAIARAARRRAHDPAVCAALTVISRDEGAHAELAWDVIALCLQRGGRPVADALREAVAHTRAPEIVEDVPGHALIALLAEHGRISAADRARCAAESTRTAVRRAGWMLAHGGPRAMV